MNFEYEEKGTAFTINIENRDQAIEVVRALESMITCADVGLIEYCNRIRKEFDLNENYN